MPHVGYRQPPEVRAKISASRKGQRHDAEHRANLAKAGAAYRATPEAKCKYARLSVKHAMNRLHKAQLAYDKAVAAMNAAYDACEKPRN